MAKKTTVYDRKTAELYFRASDLFRAEAKRQAKRRAARLKGRR